MRIKEASTLMGIPEKLITEIIDENEIEVERYLNGNHDLTFQAMIKIYSIYDGSYRATKPGNDITNWRQKVKVLSNKVRRLQEKIDKLEYHIANPPPPPLTVVPGKKVWYPRKRKNAEAID